MTELKIEHPLVVWHKDLEDFIEEKLGVRPDIQASEYSNGSYLEVEAIVVKLNNGITDEWLEEYEQSIVDFLDGDKEIDLEFILCFLATKGELAPATYLITIWW